MRLLFIYHAALITFLVSMAVILLPAHFMKTDDEVIATYPADVWQKEYDGVRAYAAHKAYAGDIHFLKAAALARVGYKGCFRQSNDTSYLLYSCTKPGEILPIYTWLQRVILLGALSFAVTLVTALMRHFQIVKRLRETAPDFRMARFWYWPFRKPHRFVGTVAYWRILSPADKHFTRMEILFALLAILIWVGYGS